MPARRSSSRRLAALSTHLGTAPAAGEAIGAGHPLLAALTSPTDLRYIPATHIHVASHCTVPADKAEEFWALSKELVPHCREEPYQVYQHCLRARDVSVFGDNTDAAENYAIEDAAREFVWLEEWTQASGFEYHASGTPYNEHFHSIIDDYTDERCGVYAGPEGMIVLPNETHMKTVGGERAGHVLVVAHVHVHPHKLAEFLVKAATLLPHCRAEKGNVFENLYRGTACAGNGSDDPCVRPADCGSRDGPALA